MSNDPGLKLPYRTATPMISDFNLTDDEIWRIIIELDKKFLETSGDSLESPGGFKLRGEEEYEPQNLCWKSSL